MDSLLTIKVEKSKTIKIICRLYTPNKSEFYEAALVYDTGADKTSITRDTLMILGYKDFKPSTHQKRSAQGTFKPDTSIVSKLIIGNQFRLNNMIVDVLEVST